MNSDQMYEVLINIARTTSTNRKISYLKAYPPLKKVLQYAYNPYYQYGIKKTSSLGRGTCRFDEWTWRLLDVLRSRKITGNQARSTLEQHMVCLTPRSAVLLYNILQKDLRCGINVKSINTAYPGLIPEFDVLLVEDFDFDRLVLPCYGSIKKDGQRGVYRYTDMLSRTGKPIRGAGHILRELNALPYYIWLDGELAIPGAHFQDSISASTSEGGVATRYYLFDIPELGQLPYLSRYDHLQNLVGKYKYVKVLKQTILRTWQEVEAFRNKAFTAGHEGIVLRDSSHRYSTGKTFNVMRIVKDIQEDLPCVGVYRGTGKYKDTLGGITIRLPEGRYSNVGSGFTDKQRNLYYNEPTRVVRRTVQILFKERTKAGKLRHPRFVRIRTDK